MKTTLKNISLASLYLLYPVLGELHAQTDTVNPMGVMDKYLGEWQVTNEDGKGNTTGASETAFIKGPGGHSVLSDFKIVSGQMQGFSLHEIIVWIPEEKKYKLMWFDSFNPGMASVDLVFDENGNARYDRSYLQGDKEIYERGTWTWTGDAIAAETYVSLNGTDWNKILGLKYRRKGVK